MGGLVPRAAALSAYQRNPFPGPFFTRTPENRFRRDRETGYGTRPGEPPAPSRRRRRYTPYTGTCQVHSSADLRLSGVVRWPGSRGERGHTRAERRGWHRVRLAPLARRHGPLQRRNGRRMTGRRESRHPGAQASGRAAVASRAQSCRASPAYRVVKAGVRAGWLSIADAPGGVLDFEPAGSAAAFVPVEFPDLVRHGEGRFEAPERELAGPCDQLLAVCPVLVSATANAGGLAEDLQYTPGGPASGVAGPSGAPAMGMLRIMSAAEPRSSCWRQQPGSPVSSCRFAAPGQPSMRPATRRFPGSSTAGAKPRSWPATRSWTSTRPRRCGRSHTLTRAVLVPVYEA